MNYLKKSFTVPVQVDISDEEWDAIWKPKKVCHRCGEAGMWALTSAETGEHLWECARCYYGVEACDKNCHYEEVDSKNKDL